MNTRSQYLWELGKQYLQDHPQPHMVCAVVGGSVGRGEADAYSDLDLTVYVADGRWYDRNDRYMDEVVQLHVQPFPSWNDVKSSPWEFRFLKEARTVQDVAGTFQPFKSRAVRFFETAEGKEQMFGQAKRIIDLRKQWVEEHLAQSEPISATLASWAVWADTAMLYAYFKHDVLASDQVFLIMHHVWEGNDWGDCLPKAGAMDRALDGIQRYRRYGREQAGEERFELSPLQDRLLRNKVNRCLEHGHRDLLDWTLYGEAFFIFLAIAKGQRMEQHLDILPDRLRDDIRQLFFQERSMKQIARMMAFSDKVVGRVVH